MGRTLSPPRSAPAHFVIPAKAGIQRGRDRCSRYFRTDGNVHGDGDDRMHKASAWSGALLRRHDSS
ncbi:MAG: hypothetical protein JXO72_01905, partial [Vicinamibacteria bacterium]|nr:hypothetical protein [Vicinamibacteria bacterium]